MSRIRILPENLANQIAAGEVVERPASVVKELVENSIDAGATDITVEVEGGGTGMVRVIDNGEGMDQDDILLSLERHATSKLVSVDQLDHIRTLGFRGEAMPSIASVSRMTVTSRLPTRDLGSRVEIKFGKVVKVHEMGAAPGTVVEVRDLFGNLPARRKFLKSVRTELAHVEETVLQYGLVRPDLNIRYRVNNREVMAVSAVDSDRLESRLKRLLKFPPQATMINIRDYSPNEDAQVKVAGVFLEPDAVDHSGVGLRAFVNGRPVRDRLLRHAVTEGFRNYLMKGRLPVGVLFLKVPETEVDVNVHPTKQEVRFRRPSVIHQAIVAALQQGLVGHQSIMKAALFQPGGADPTTSAFIGRGSQVADPGRSPGKLAGQAAVETEKTCSPLPVPRGRLIDRKDSVPFVAKTSEPSVAYDRIAESASDIPPGPLCSTPVSFGGVTRQEESHPVRVIGQLFDTYLLCQVEDGFLVIDQHAAQERLIFERLKKQYERGAVVRQGLLFPETVELSPAELTVLENFADRIATLGLDFQEFGGTTVVIKAVPAILGHLSPGEVIRELLARFGSTGPRAGAQTDAILAGMACKAALKANHRLTVVEQEALVAEMQANDVFSHCPHGRPVARKFTGAEVKKWFFRT
ncbi:MAG: DNA mismatch repair endonuclease MutL [Proteobacteria bacterium]|nr:DNA mismatch repair endonuclease MutL [Pseudomonadota bacterium]MBU1688232.1 DNA mismatch repair endonuclease MutL [Pseudomonadota bacterium]